MKATKAQLRKNLAGSPSGWRVWLWLVLCIGLAGTASAATYTVTKTADTKDGTCNADCSLREAIDAANGAGAGPHTINIPAGTYTISGAGDDTNTAGDFDINVAMDFVGAGSASTILSGNLADRIFHVRVAGIPVSVTGMKFTQGRAGAGSGGGIYSLSGNITVTDSIFDDCDGSQGGALYTNNASTITISGSTITNSNGGSNGGAVNGGIISVTSSTFTNNTGAHGGAIFASAAAGSVTVTGASSFSGNSASGIGGAIYASNTASITGATFNLNHADTSAQRGGAVHVAGLGQFTNCTITNNTTANLGGGISGGAAIEITNSTISGNTATSGGGVYSQTTLTISATTTINGNTASTHGGGVYANGAATVTGATISGNTATSGAGGGLYTASTLTINPSTTIDGNIAGGSAGGGGVYANGAATVNGATITNNTNNTATGTVRGGGIYVAGNSTFTNSTISNNTIAAGQGGGIGTNSFTLNISNSTISGNRSNTNSGGGIWGQGVMTITDSTFSGNSAGGGSGGAISTYGFSITRSTFSSNSSTTTGGAIYVQNAVGNFYGANTFTGNHANGSGGNAGGCIYSNSQAITINDAGSVFSGNYGGGKGGCIWINATLNINAATIFDGNYTTAAGGGGAIYSQSSGAMTNATFRNNYAPDLGGAFYPTNAYTINNSTFEGNYLTASTVGGGAIYLPNFGVNYALTLNNSTFSGNNAGAGQGGAIYSENSNPTVNAYNSTFYNNTGTTTMALKSTGANKIVLYNSIVAHPSSAALCSNTVRGSTSNNVDFNNSGNCVAAGAGRITTDPLLVALAYNGGPTQTMALQSTSSSAYDASATGATANDQRGVAAIGTRDIGAYEYSGVAGDTTAPAPITTLATGIVTSTTVPLTWTAPGDDYSTGTATTYDVRYSTSPITEGNWASATAATGEPAPSVAGTSENFTVTGLSASTTYYFAVKTSDEVPNTSTISNVVSATTTAGGATTTLATGTDPGNTSLAPGGAATNAGAFSFQTSSGTDVITAATVTLAAGTSGGLSLVEITNVAGTTVYGSASNPASDTPAITLSTNTLTATTTLTEYRIRVTPKSHANMPAPAGSSYAVTALISAFTGTNAQAGSDTAGTTVTIDNLSTANATAATATAGDTQVALAWTNPADGDLHSLVVLRRATSAVADTPVEGTTYVVGNTIGTATVACVVSAPTASCNDTGLTNGTAYHYLIFAKDSNGNYSATGVVPTGSPATPVASSTSSLHPSALASNPGTWFATNWASDLDSNDGDITNANKCCSGPTLKFYVDMDNPVGLGGATINSITINAVVKCSAAGVLTTKVGYMTDGATTIWTGDAACGTSYATVTGGPYTTDSAGGALDLTDLNNLQIAVDRVGTGPTAMYVTEVYVDVNYTPGANTAPVGGYTTDNVIPSAQVSQATDGTGLVTINWKGRDDQDNNVTIKTFQYSVDGGTVWNAPTNGDASASLSTNWNNNGGAGWSTATTLAAATAHSFTFNTKHADVTGLNGVDQSDVQVRFLLNDGTVDSAAPATSQNVRVDDLNPTATITSATYDAATDTMVITGANFTTIAAAATDIKGYVDWTKFVWDINGDNATTANISVALGDVTSLTVTNATTLTLVFTGAKSSAIEVTAGYGSAGGADTIDVTAGFSKDYFGNTATTDAVVDGILTVNIQSFTVTKTADTNDGSCDVSDCSIREAVAAANASADANTIIIPTGIYTITRSGSDDTNINGDFDITNPVSIVGAGSGATIIRAGADAASAIDRIFHVTNTSAVTIEAVKLQYGKISGAGGCINASSAITINSSILDSCAATANNGGAVYSGGAITLDNCTLTNNSAGINGGAIYTNGLTSAGGATFTGNYATGAGGAIYSAGTNNVSIDGTVLFDNNDTEASTGDDGGSIWSGGNVILNPTTGSSTFQNCQAEDGGAIYISTFGKTLTATNGATFNNNNAVYYGGAVYISGGTLSNINFSGNYTSQNRGGAIYSQSTNELIISGANNIFNNNHSGNAPGVYGGNIFSGGNLTVSNATFTGDNDATADAYWGGAIATEAGKTLNLSNCSFANFYTVQYGGAVYANGGGTFTNVTFTGNRVANDDGGAIFNTGAALTINGASNIFTNNYAANGVGDYGGTIYSAADLTISNAAFTGDNDATADAEIGGAIYMAGGAINLNNSSFANFYASTNAGAVYTRGGTFTDVTFTGNHAGTQRGGAIYNITAALTINGASNIFTNNYTANTSWYGGGSIYSITALTISNAAFTGNNDATADADYGGAIFMDTTAALTVTNSSFKDFFTNGGAGAVYLKAGSITGSTFSNNRTNGIGGAVRQEGAGVQYSNSTFSANSAATGGAINSASYACTITNSTFYNNTASSSAEAITGSTCTIKNSIVAKSTASASLCSGVSSGNYNLQYNGTCFTAQANDLSSNPQLGVLANNGGLTWTHAPQGGSPAIDAASNAVCAAAPINNVDQIGTVRPVNGGASATCDIGSFEYVPSGITISGTLYSDEGTTVIATGPTVRLIANGASVGTAVANGSGVYSITANVNSGDALIAYIDSNGGTVGNAVTVSNGANLAGLNIYADRVITRHDNGGSLTNALMGTALGAYSDTDILYSVSGGALTANGASTELFVWTGHTFAPGGTITATHMDINGTLDAAANAINVAGNWDATGGVFTSTGTVTFNAASGTNTITPGGTDANHDFQNIVFNDAAGTATFQLGGAIDADGDFTVTDGIFDTAAASSYAVTVAGILSDSANGRFKANASTITVGGNVSLNANNDATESADFNGASLVLNGAASQLTYASLNAAWNNGFNNLTVGAAGVTDTLNSSFSILNDLTVGTGGLTGAVTLYMRGTDGNVLFFDAASTLTLTNLTLLANAVNLPTLTNGYNTNIVLGGVGPQTVTQTGAVTLNSGKHLKINGDGVTTRTNNLDTGGFALTVGGDLIIGAGVDTGAKGLTANGSTISVAGNFTLNVGVNYFSAGTSTVIMNGAADQTIYAPGVSFKNLTLNNTGASGSDDVIISLAMDVNGVLTITDGDLDISTNNPAVNTAGSVSIGANGSIDVTGRTANWTFDGTTTLTDSSTGGPQQLNNVVLNGTSVTLGSSTKMKSLTVTAGTMNLGASGYTLELTGTGTPLSNSGTFTAGTSTVKYTGTTTATNIATVAYSSLQLAPTAATTYSLTGHLTGGNALTGALTIGANATLDTTGSNYNIALAGNWSNSGGFTANSGTVTLAGTNQSITGPTTFNNLTKSVASAATLTFAAGSTTTVNGTATLNGASGQLLSLVSSSPGTYWNFTLGAASTKAISYVSVTDSDASGSAAAKKPVNPTNSTDGGHNVSWFGGTPSLTFLKTVAVTSDPVNGATGPKYIPGAEVLFTMRVTNSGAGTVDNNTLVITDPVAANTELFTGDLGGGKPFIFTDGTPVSGLTCAFVALNNFADCVDFSNDSGVSWTFVPNGSFDPAVTNIRFSLGGAMNGTGGGNPYFDLNFRVRVK